VKEEFRELIMVAEFFVFFICWWDKRHNGVKENIYMYINISLYSCYLWRKLFSIKTQI